MVVQPLDRQHFSQKVQQIRAHVPTALTQRGLLPKFTSWRLTQDPDTGMVVLFGILNEKYIAAHTQTPFGAYFDPRLLHDLATDLQVEVIPSNSEGLRYAFVLDRSQLGQPTGLVEPSLPPQELLIEEMDNHRPLMKMAYDPNRATVLTESTIPAFIRPPVYRHFVGGFQPALKNPVDNLPGLQLPLLSQAALEADVQLPTLLFTLPPHYPERLNDYLPAAGGNLEALPRLLLVLEEYNDLLRTLCGSAEEFAQVAASFARIGRTWGISLR